MYRGAGNLACKSRRWQFRHQRSTRRSKLLPLIRIFRRILPCYIDKVGTTVPYTQNLLLTSARSTFATSGHKNVFNYYLPLRKVMKLTKFSFTEVAKDLKCSTLDLHRQLDQFYAELREAHAHFYKISESFLSFVVDSSSLKCRLQGVTLPP